jgi:hypothetical protein
MALVDKSCGVPAQWATTRSSGSKAPRSAVPLLVACATAALLIHVSVAHDFWLGALWTFATLAAWIFMRGAAEASAETSRERRF